MKVTLTKGIELENNMKKKYGTIIALVASVALITIGFLQGQNSSVLAKAVKICLECIGIG